MRRIVLSAVAVAALAAAVPQARADWQSTIGWGCHTRGFKNGTSFNGATARPSASEYKAYRDRLGYGGSNGADRSGAALGNRLSVSAVILPSGEFVTLR